MSAQKDSRTPDRVLYEQPWGAWTAQSVHRVRPTVRRVFIRMPKARDGKRAAILGDVYRVSIGPAGTVRVTVGSGYYERPLAAQTARQLARDIDVIRQESFQRYLARKGISKVKEAS